ncbi:hypothetical protein BpHYR1_047281 [Brachionus plicatilis]|uniref:Uncharacterized protein n=1 Tax=Brachionus plicatilis TaxID=10195 RepID=A0A3M7PR34_BRAPC|nr:hypothetical protein BpHYR1_047281 [Brachionus plicatilis]
MYNRKNLLNVRASNQTSFVSMIIDILFTHEEQNNGPVIKVKPTAKRSQLEPSRVQLLKDTWYSVGKIANIRCYDAAKLYLKPYS